MQSIQMYKIGYLKSYSSAASFNCKHSVTKRPICAIPCNGLIELCENDADEQCEGPGLVKVLIFTLIFALVVLSTALVIRKLKLSTEPNISNEEGRLQGRFHYNSLHFTLNYHRSNFDIKKAKMVAIDYHKQNVSGGKDEYFMDVFGTNDHTAFFYDCVSEAFSIKIACFIQDFFPNTSILNEWNIQPFIEVLLCVVRLTLRYSDLSKDLLLLYIMWLQLGNYEFGSFPIVVFSILSSSIIICEIGTLLITSNYEKNWRKTHPKRWFTLILLTPIFPALYLYRILLLKLRMIKAAKSFTDDSMLEEVTQAFSKTEEEINNLRLKSAHLHCCENIVENFVQLTIVLMIIFLKNTASRAVVNFDMIFVDENGSLGVVLVSMSFVSLVAGQMKFLKAKKNGCSAGVFIIIPYFMIGCASRLVRLTF